MVCRTGRPVGKCLMSGILRYKDGLWPNAYAISYVFAAYIIGLLLMLSSVLPLNFTGALLFAHSMVIAAYLVHECAHNSVFRKNSYHRWLAELLLWICGASYSDYEDIRHKHVRHHTDKADIVLFDYRTKITAYPNLLKAVYIFEWFYIPAMEIIMHMLVVILPFVNPERKPRRVRVLFVLIARFVFFVALSSISFSILIFYPIAYMMFLIVMRFMDVHQHTYELFETLYKTRGAEAKKRDREFEDLNTYSNLLSVKYPWVNLLVLNFSYHNAHHKQPGTPWYQLPTLHVELYGNEDRQILSFIALLKSYRKNRIQRVLNEDVISMPVKQMGDRFIGVDGVSFLIAH